MSTPVPAAPDPVPLDEFGRLCVDIECRSCGYNLRGVALDGSCPECTTAVGRSVHGDLLRFSDPAWVDRLARGGQWFVGAIVGGFVAAILIGAVMAVSFATVGGFSPVALTVVILTGGVLIAVQLYAYWLVTTPDPGRDESAQPFTPRAIARYTLIASIFIEVGAMFLDPSLLTAFAGGAAGTTPAIPSVISAFVILAASATSLVGVGALFVYARTLATRMPDDALARRTRIVTWGYLVPAALAAVTLFVGFALGANVTGIFEIVHGLISLPSAVFAIWGIVLVFQYRARLRGSAAAARATWAAPAGAPVPPIDLSPPVAAGDDGVTRMLLPVGRSALSIVAGYVALFAVLLVPAPVALILGIVALRHLKRHPDLHGRGRAIFAIVMGTIFTIVLAVVVVATVIG